MSSYRRGMQALTNKMERHASEEVTYQRDYLTSDQTSRTASKTLPAVVSRVRSEVEEGESTRVRSDLLDIIIRAELLTDTLLDPDDPDLGTFGEPERGDRICRTMDNGDVIQYTVALVGDRDVHFALINADSAYKIHTIKTGAVLADRRVGWRAED